MQPIPEIDLSSNIRESDVAHQTNGRRQLSLTDEDFTPRPVASRTDWSTVAARPTEHVGGHEWEMGNGLRCTKRVYCFYGNNVRLTNSTFADSLIIENELSFYHTLVRFQECRECSKYVFSHISVN